MGEPYYVLLFQQVAVPQYVPRTCWSSLESFSFSFSICHISKGSSCTRASSFVTFVIFLEITLIDSNSPGAFSIFLTFSSSYITRIPLLQTRIILRLWVIFSSLVDSCQ